jgi:hypothetical protein
MRHGRVHWISGRRGASDGGDTAADDSALSEPRSEPGAAVASGAWWSPLAQLLRTEVQVASGQVNRDRDSYQLGEWVRSGSAMAAFTLGRDEADDQAPPEARGRRHLTLQVVVAIAVEVADHAFAADGVDWVYPEGHLRETNVVAGAVDGAQMAGFLERVAQQVGGAARVGRVDGLMAAFSRADALYLTRSARG